MDKKNFDTIDAALEDIRQGKLVIVIDDDDREIELLREKIILDKKIRKTSLDLKKMITAILEES